jgi:hypothetical protein
VDWTPNRVARLNRILKANASCAAELQMLIYELSDYSGAKSLLIAANEHLAQVENAILEVRDLTELARDLSVMLNQLDMDNETMYVAIDGGRI